MCATKIAIIIAWFTGIFTLDFIRGQAKLWLKHGKDIFRTGKNRKFLSRLQFRVAGKGSLA